MLAVLPHAGLTMPILPTITSTDASMPDPTLEIVLYQPEIPYNAGAVGRTCVAIGARLWLVRPLGFQTDHRHVRRAGLDYWELVDWHEVDGWDELQERLPDRNFWYLTKSGQTAYTDVAFQQGDVLVFGSESKGLPPSLLESHPERTIRVPTRKEIRSLNLSVTAGIVTYEAIRQLNLK